MRARVAAHLENTVACGRAFDPGAALDQLLLDLGALGGEEELVFSLCPDHRLANDDVRPGHSFVSREALRDLLVQRDLEGVAVDGCAVRRARGRDGRELSRRMPTGGSAREGAGPKRRLASAFVESRRSHAKPHAPFTRTRTPIPSLSESASRSTRPFFVATNWLRLATTRASAYSAPAPVAASTAAAQRSRTAEDFSQSDSMGFRPSRPETDSDDQGRAKPDRATLCRTLPRALVAELVDALG